MENGKLKVVFRIFFQSQIAWGGESFCYVLGLWPTRQAAKNAFSASVHVYCFQVEFQKLFRSIGLYIT